MTKPLNKHLNGQDVAQLIDFVLNPKTTDPGSPTDNVPWINTTDGRVKVQTDGTNTETFAFLSDINGINRYRGVWDASTGIPTAAGSAVLANDPIKAGDFWRVSVAGTIAGIVGADQLEVGDVLFAGVDTAATAADFFALQVNADISGMPSVETVTVASVPANTATDATPGTLAGGVISSWKIVSSTGVDLTDSFDVVLDQTTPKISITSLTAQTNLDVLFVGDPA